MNYRLDKNTIDVGKLQNFAYFPVRQNHWIIELYDRYGNLLSGIPPYLFHKCEMDYVKKELKFSIRDVGAITDQDTSFYNELKKFLKVNNSEGSKTMMVITYIQGSGEIMKTDEFLISEVLKCIKSIDYASPDFVNYEITASFEL